MARHPDKNRYALAVGHVAIEWNYLEHDLQQLGYHYLTVDADVAAHIFAFMGNVTKVEFIGYLVEKFETNDAVKPHIHKFLKIYNRLRGNRNVVEHGVPAITETGVYLDKIIKIDRRGDAMPFAASQETLNLFLKDLQRAREYAKAIHDILQSKQKAAKANALKKPSLPKRLNSLPFRSIEN
ncbi:MAG: hypothetical protein HKN14_03985 [Marinicaulis sp.]|nr:hypothetical protein [Marinicaulis sp.]NNE40060.1 hypothetical protein [Marinicaulis sp.]NNL89015.1 hypothetical protein [Marinicaulis sp.]